MTHEARSEGDGVVQRRDSAVEAASAEDDEERLIKLMIETFPPGSYLRADAALSDIYPPQDDQLYRLGDHLNCGRTGIVQAAVVCRSEIEQAKPAAIKLMFGSIDGSDPERHMQRARRELHTLLAAQECCGVVELLDAFQVRRHTAIVMPMYRTTARSFLFLYERIPVSVAVPLIRQLTQTVAALHTDLEPRVIIHGDIKPENVLITDANETVLIDFGASSIVDIGTTTTILPENVSFHGSIAYTPPESVGWVLKHSSSEHQRGNTSMAQVQAFAASERQQMSTDVWALGITAFELLVGFTPYQMAVTLYGTNMSHPDILKLVTDPIFLSLLLSHAATDGLLSREAVSYLGRALDVSPATRATATELASHLFVANAATKPKRLECSADLARNNFLPPNALHGVAPTRKPKRYVPPALVVMKKAYTSFCSISSPPRLVTANVKAEAVRDDSVVSQSNPKKSSEQSSERVRAPAKPIPSWTKLSEWGGAFFGWTRSKADPRSLEPPTQESLEVSASLSLVRPELTPEKPRRWLTSNPPPETSQGLTRMLSTRFASSQPPAAPASAPASPSIPQASTVPEVTDEDVLPASIASAKGSSSEDERDESPSSRISSQELLDDPADRSGTELFESPASIPSVALPSFRTDSEEHADVASRSPWESLIPEYDATLDDLELEAEKMGQSDRWTLRQRDEPELKPSTGATLITALFDSLASKIIPGESQSQPVTPRDILAAEDVLKRPSQTR